MIIPATPKTPLIRFNPKSSKLELIGRSIPEDAEEFYQPVFQLLRMRIKNPNSSLKVVVQFEYYNTHTSRILVELLRVLESMIEAGHLIKVFWVCEEEDEETIDYGEDLKQLVQVPIETTVLSEDKYDEFLAHARYVTVSG